MKNTMKNVSIGLLLACAGAASVAQGQVVISQAYGAGGNNGAVLNADYVELHNITNNPVNLAGWSIQYASSTGSFNNKVNLNAGTIPAGGYYLVQLAASGANGAPLPTPDLIADSSTGTIFAGATAGKFALVSNQTLVGATCPSPSMIDLVGYGTATTCAEGGAPTPNLSTTLAAFRNNNGCTDTNNNAADFVTATPAPRNSASATVLCGGIVDCNGNSIDDAIEIAGNPSLDCNTNGVIDSCEITSGTDCNSNGIIDSCEIAANPGLDCNSNGIIDSCDIVLFADFDGGSCGAPNGVLDSCETPGPGEDCNANGVKDCWEFKTYVLTDVNNNGIADVCEGAIVLEASINGTVQATGVRSGANGDAFFNIEGINLGTFRSYGAIRFDNTAFASLSGVGQVYLQLTQSNAAFTAGGIPGIDPDNIEVFYTNNDTIDIAPGNTTTLFDNFATDFADAQSVDTYTFVQGTNPPPALPGAGSGTGNGTIEVYSLFDSNASPTAAQLALAADIAAGTGNTTLTVNPITGQDYVAATYAGRTNNLYRGPTLVVFPGGPTLPTCNSIDFNGDGLFPDDGDLIDFLNVSAGGFCSNDPNCDTTDFNNDGLFPDDQDLIDFLTVAAGGTPASCNP